MALTTEEKFFSKVKQIGSDPIESCWEWQASRIEGYGQFYPVKPEKRCLAHRWSFEFFRAPLGKLVIDHLCRNRACVNPWHLDAVTLGENTRRSNLWATLNRTHCRKGLHSIEEFAVLPDGRRTCKPCLRATGREMNRRHRARQKASVAS